MRAGTGGDEAALFCGDLIKLYTKYAESQGWTVRLASASESETGGFRDATLEVKGDSVYSKLKFEAGVHRVQRVPATETQGRVHTSTATVAIMPEVDEVAVEIDMKLSQSDLAEMAGATREAVNKQMRGWAQDGMISTEGGYITVRQMDSLLKLARQVII